MGINPDIRRGRSVVHVLHAQLVSVPKYRRGVFTNEILNRCEEIMREVCTKANTELREFNGERDHVHLVIHYPPGQAVRLRRQPQGRLRPLSPQGVRRPHPRKYLWGEHFWSPSYLAAFAGGAPLSVIKEYIEQRQRPLERGRQISPEKPFLPSPKGPGFLARSR
ncbi:IS200/IS605 family transposase [Streptomyces sp. NPDC055144]